MSRSSVTAAVLISVVCGAVSARTALAQNGGRSGIHPTAAPSVAAIPRTGPITVDGVLDEEIWRSAPAATDFRQSIPTEGAAATLRTEVRFVFDDGALYIGARMYDPLGRAGVRTRLVRRDQLYGESDELSIVFDTFHDHLGRTQFQVNPSGVRGDAYGPGGAFTDPSWEPVYEVRTAIDGEGWTAEFRIPLSQLRFPRDSVQTWGLQIVRFAARLNERTHWSWWGNNESGGPSRYGHLEELALTRAPRGLELLPYVVGQSTRLGRTDPANPFQREQQGKARTGLDLTYRLTSNLTLSATVNPDFGQVEVDPAVVNLGVFETFFPERRPFFVEGAGLFRFGGLSCFSCSNASGLSLLHSRRIGRTPQGGPAAFAQGPYADLPDNTAILGAAKITGRTQSGWSIGVLNAITAREHADVWVDPATTRSVEVEPFTNYFAARIARDLRGGNTQVRLMATSVIRDLADSALADRLNSHSEVLGVETENWFANRRWRLLSMAAVSQISGDTGSILRAQLSSARYFQRPDREHGGNGLFTDRYDPTLTSMRGYALYNRLSKDAGNWIGDFQVNVRHPGFEANDLAFNTRMDFIWLNGNIRRRWTTPTRYYRYFQVGLGGQYETNFDGDRVGAPQLHGSWYWELPSNWWFSMYGHLRPERLDERLTRGGPAVGRPGGEWFINWSFGTDQRRALYLNAYGWASRNDERMLDMGSGASAQVRPASNISLSVGPEYYHLISRHQFVRSFDDPAATGFFGRRYIFADLDQVTLSMNTRLNVTFTPALSFELFAQPLVVAAEYRGFKEFARPRDSEKLVYGRDIGTIAADATGYDIDPDGAGPAAPFRVDRPDFTFRSLRGNAILRWEFRPGSTLYLVWTQARSGSDGSGNMAINRDLRALGRVPSDNVFLVKVSWWVGL
jgi:hypothetical protein